MIRKIVIALMAVTYLFGCGVIPPLMDVWNREGFIGPIPYFFAGLWTIAALLVLETLFLYWYERKDDTFKD